MFVSTTQYVYNSPPTHSIEQLNIYQPKSTDVVITTPGALGRWSHTDQLISSYKKLKKKKKKKLLTAKELCEYVTAEFQGFAYWNLEDLQLFHAIHDTFKNWPQYQ